MFFDSGFKICARACLAAGVGEKCLRIAVMKNSNPWTILALAFALVSPVAAAPEEIIFLRHAEKPDHGPELNARGWERAKALATLFSTDHRVLARTAGWLLPYSRRLRPRQAVRSDRFRRWRRRARN